MTVLPSVDALRRDGPGRAQTRMPRQPPVVRRLSVDTDLCVEGDDIVLRWEVADAEHVAIDDLAGVPTTGSARVLAERSRSFTVRATNQSGEVARATPRVTVLRMPAIGFAPVVLPYVRARDALVRCSPVMRSAPPTLAPMGGASLRAPTFSDARAWRPDAGA